GRNHRLVSNWSRIGYPQPPQGRDHTQLGLPLVTGAGDVLVTSALELPIDGEGALAVGATVALRVVHALEVRQVTRRIAFRSANGANAAHGRRCNAAISTPPDAGSCEAS